MKCVSLFSKEAVEKLRRDKFSGKISVCWDNGIINDLRTDMQAKDEMLLEEL